MMRHVHGLRRTAIAIWLGTCAAVLAGRMADAQQHALAGAGSFTEAALSQTSDARARERYRAAAALQNRELYDLAVTEWAAFVERFSADPLAVAARFQHGVCLFQLERYEEAQAEFRAVTEGAASLEPALAEQAYVYLGLSQYNVGRAAENAGHAESLDAAIDTLGQYLERSPDGPLAGKAAFYRAEALYARGRLEAAIKAYRALVERFPNHSQRAEAIYALGVAEREHGELQAAADTLEKLRSEFPDHSLAVEAQLQRGELLLALGERDLDLGRVEQATQTLAMAAALPRGPHSDAALVALADAQFGRGNTASAIQTLDRLLAEFPQSELLERAYLRRGDFHAALEDWPAAVADLGQLLQRWPNGALVPQALVARARAELRQAEPMAAEASLDQFLAEYPQHDLALEARLLRATVRHGRGDFAGGLEDAETILSANPRRRWRSEAWYVRGLCEMGLGKPAAAVESFSRIVRKDPQYRALDRVLYDLAWAQRECGDAERATATFEQLAESFPKSTFAAESRYHVGEAQYAAGEFAAAAKSFWSAGERTADPELLQKALHKLAWSCFKQQQFEAAEEAFDRQITVHHEALESAPDQPAISGSLGPLTADALIMIGECRHQREQFGGALDVFAAALDEPAGSAALRELALLHAGQSAAQLKQWQRSFEFLDRCLSQYPDTRWTNEARYERGWALYHLERLDEAQRDFEAVAAHGTDVLAARAEFMTGEVLFAKKQYDEAVRTFFKVAYGYGERDAPEPFHHWQAEAMFEAARCLEEIQRLDSARQLYRELVERYPESPKAQYARVSLEKMLR